MAARIQKQTILLNFIVVRLSVNSPNSPEKWLKLLKKQVKHGIIN